MTISLSPTQIKITDRLQPRYETNRMVVDDYAESMKAGQIFPPVEVVFDGENYWLWDGFHRRSAAIQAGIEQLSVNVTEGDLAEAEWLALGANKVHGMRRSNVDKRRAVRLAFGHPKIVAEVETYKKPNYSQIAEHCGVSHMFVRNLWLEINPPEVSEKSENRNGFNFHSNLNGNSLTHLSPTEQISKEIRDVIRYTPIVEDRRELERFAKLPEEKQVQVAEKIVTGENSSVKSAIRKVQYESRLETIKPVDADWLIVGDLCEVGSQIPDGSIDLIFTDPPYDKEAVKLYGALAELGKRVLKPSGILVAYSGQMHLPQIMTLMGEHLDYMWMCGIGHTGGATWFRKWNLNNQWKPLLMYGKPPIVPYWNRFDDFISGGREKDHHEWQQSLTEACHYIEALCPPGGAVLDPFLGSGTTLVAAKQLGRQYFGIEIDEVTARAAQERIVNVSE